MAYGKISSYITPRRYWKIWGHQDAIIKEIDRICRQKLQANIEPARATWRELREVLNEQEQREFLPNLVALNVIEKQRTIAGESYSVNWPRANKLKADRSDRNQWP